MLESYKELIAAKSEINMLKRQLKEAERVVHCKDCFFGKPYDWGFETPNTHICLHPGVGGFRKADFFCGFGSKKVEK